MQPFLIGMPRRKPDALIKALRALFMRVDLIETAYIAQIFNPLAKEPPHLAIGLIVSGDLKNIVMDIEKIIKMFVDETEFVDVIYIGVSGMEKAFSNLSPFYVAGEA